MAGAMKPMRAALRTMKKSCSISNRQYSQTTTPLSASTRKTTITRAFPPLQSRLPLLRRSFSATSSTQHGNLQPPKPGEEINITIIDKDGHPNKFQVCEGDNILDIASFHDLEMEGACEGSCSCSTCHVIVEDEAMFDKMEEATDEENDMLDLAFALTETSRLGCQVKMTKALDGIVVRLPPMTRNLQASDFAQRG